MKDQIFDVGYLSAVKIKLKVLLCSEITPISEMSHDGEEKHRSIEDEGKSSNIFVIPYHILTPITPFQSDMSRR